MQPILTQSQQFPWRTAAVKRAIATDLPLAERFRALQTPVIAATNNHSDRVDWRDVIDRPFSDEEERQLRHLLELASRITAAVIQPGDTGSGGPMFSGDDDSLFGPGAAPPDIDPPFFGPVIDPPAPAYPPTSIADATAVPNADFQAQVETGTGVFNPSIPGHGDPGVDTRFGPIGGTPPDTGPPEPGGPGSGGGQFNPQEKLGTQSSPRFGPLRSTRKYANWAAHCPVLHWTSP
jgi:hypothetical protein